MGKLKVGHLSTWPKMWRFALFRAFLVKNVNADWTAKIAKKAHFRPKNGHLSILDNPLSAPSGPIPDISKIIRLQIMSKIF